MTNVMIAVLLTGRVLFGIGLAVASRKLAESDPRIERLRRCFRRQLRRLRLPRLPGTGGNHCRGSAPVNACPVTTDCGAIAEVMGVEALPATGGWPSPVHRREKEAKERCLCGQQGLLCRPPAGRRPESLRIRLPGLGQLRRGLSILCHLH